MKRLLVRIVGVILVVGALGMLAMFWSDSRSGYSPAYKHGVERKVAESEQLVNTLKAQHAPQEKIDAAMMDDAQSLEELANIAREENRHHSYWQKFYALIAAAVLAGLVALYFGFRKPRTAAAA